jgi:hypothetical protein
MNTAMASKLRFDNYCALWALLPILNSVIPAAPSGLLLACPESFRKDSRRALLANSRCFRHGNDIGKKHSNNRLHAVSLRSAYFWLLLGSLLTGDNRSC